MYETAWTDQRRARLEALLAECKNLLEICEACGSYAELADVEVDLRRELEFLRQLRREVESWSV